MPIDQLTSVHGRRLAMSKEGHLVSEDAYVTGLPGTPQIVMPGAHDTVALFEDFLGDAIPGEWNAVENTDTGADASIAISAATNGVVLLTSGKDDSGGYTALNSELNWKADQGNLQAAIRLRIPTITTVSVFFGFTDTKNAEPPIFEDTGTAAQVSNATDAVGFLFSTANSHTKIQLVGVKNGTDATPVDLDVAPTANVYETWALQSDTGGDFTFWRNGAYVGKIDDAVTETVALTPVIGIHPHTNATRTVAADYINVSSGRDTGT